MSEEYIRDFYGKILGKLEDQGNRIIARDFYGVRVGLKSPFRVGLKKPI